MSVTSAAAGSDDTRRCAWCLNPLPAGARPNRLTCSQPCRQAKALFRIAQATETDDKPMHFAYADPPYPGRAARYYGQAEVDHEALIAGLESAYPDGWALSTAADSLPRILDLCPGDVRVFIWIRRPRPHRRRGPHNTYEPLIVAHGRKRLITAADQKYDVLQCASRQYSHPGAIVGMKPAAFAAWMFQALGALKGDTLHDLFPGSGAITRAWDLYQGNATNAPHNSQTT